jgi:hypothetical protein
MSKRRKFVHPENRHDGTVSNQDVAANIVIPELESALYAALVKNGPRQIYYNEAGLRMLQEATIAALLDIGPKATDELRRRANEAVVRLLKGDI